MHGDAGLVFTSREVGGNGNREPDCEAGVVRICWFHNSADDGAVCGRAVMEFELSLALTQPSGIDHCVGDVAMELA